MAAVQGAHCVTGTIEAERNCQTGSVLAPTYKGACFAACDGDLKKESNGHQNATFALGDWMDRGREVNSGTDSTRWSVRPHWKRFCTTKRPPRFLAPPPSLISRCYNFVIYGEKGIHIQIAGCTWRPEKTGKLDKQDLGRAGQKISA